MFNYVFNIFFLGYRSMFVGKGFFYFLFVIWNWNIILIIFIVVSIVLGWFCVMWNEEIKCVVEFWYGNLDLKIFFDGLEFAG